METPSSQPQQLPRTHIDLHLTPLEVATLLAALEVQAATTHMEAHVRPIIEQIQGLRTYTLDE